MDEFGLRVLTTAEVMAIALGNKDGLDPPLDIPTSKRNLGDMPAARQELAQEPGVGEVTARRLLAILELGRRFAGHPTRAKSKSHNAIRCRRLPYADLMNLDQERLVVLALNAPTILPASKPFTSATSIPSIIRMAEIFNVAVRRAAPRRLSSPTTTQAATHRPHRKT